jgi:hypothetical protein
MTTMSVLSATRGAGWGVEEVLGGLEVSVSPEWFFVSIAMSIL